MFMKSICISWLALAAAVWTPASSGADNQYTEVACSFEPASLCGWENEPARLGEVTSQWIRANFLSTVIDGVLDPTIPGLGYGPFSDHSGDSYYAATTGLGGAVARLITPMVQGSKVAPVTVLSFWYHVGSTQANLAARIVHEDRSKPRTTVWSLAGGGVALGRGDAWLLARTTINYPAKFQVVFEAEMNSQNESVYVGLDDILLRTGQLLKTCDFEGSIFGDLCHFYQAEITDDSADDFDWTRQRGETPSLDTGPLFDHTFGEGQNGHYIFIEATRPEEEKSAVLYSLKYYKVPGGSCTLEFFYHSFGTDIGELNVLVGNQGHSVPLTNEDEWKKHEIDLTNVSGNYRIAFQGIRGDGNLGDVAIDDISFVGDDCTGIDVCASYPCLNGGTCTQVGDSFTCECLGRDIQPICEEGDYADENGTAEIQCTFLSLDLCKWESELVEPESEVTIEWSRQQTGGLTTGPSQDHSGDEFFARANGQDGATARMYTPVVPGSREAPNTVLTFWYHVNSKMANLTVFAVHEDRSRPRDLLWSVPQTGVAMEATDPWLGVWLNINYPAKFQVAFEAHITDSSRAYVALDDVRLQTGKLPQSCDFEGSIYGDLCLFYQVSDGAVDDFDWTRLSGDTPSAGTGPSFDHTFEESGNGRYLYLEATGPNAGEKAVLSSLEFFKMEGTPCTLQFYYHALGSDLGELSVIVSGQVYPVSLANLDEWRKEEIDLKDVGGKYTVSFEGVRGSGDLGDIAIDDFNLVGDGCMAPDVCASAPCLNGGTCTRVGSDYTCSCRRDFPGSNCEAEPVREPLSVSVIVTISLGAVGSAVALFVLVYLMCAGCPDGNKVTAKVTAKPSEPTDFAMSSQGLTNDGYKDDKQGRV